MNHLRKCLQLTSLIILSLSSKLWAVPGDINRDGVVDFEDFFIFADNFGKSGSPEVDIVYDTLKVEVEQIKTVYDTLQLEYVTVFDTVTLGREPIRFDPPPPLDEITQGLELKGLGYFNIRIFDYLIGEIDNTNSTSIDGWTMRLTVRNDNGSVIYTTQFSYTLPQLLIAHDTRPFRVSLSDDVPLDQIRAGNYEIDVKWDDTLQQVNNVSVQLDTSRLVYGEPFSISGEILNTSDLTVENYEIVFFGRDADGAPIYYQSYSESEFGISPGGSSPFTIAEVKLDYGGPYTQRENIAEMYYYIEWQWSTSSYSEYETSPLTRLF